MTTCSELSAALGEPLAGTAPVARTWIVVENRGTWGRDALTDSDLPDPVRALLLEAKRQGVGVQLARHPDRPERAGVAGHHVWVARSAAGGVRLRHGVLDSLDPLLAWDIDEFVAGRLPALGTSDPQPLLLVCTHGKRDLCCAVRGRDLVTSLLAAVDEPGRSRIWETSHIGGHRFAPVTLSLPSGTVHGRLSAAEAIEVLRRQEEGRVLVDRMRGRSAFPAPFQAADLAVRRAEGIDGCDDLDVLLVQAERAVPVDLGWAVPMGAVTLEVRHVDGRTWRVEVAGRTGDDRRPESCGGDPVPVHDWSVSGVSAAPAWRSEH